MINIYNLKNAAPIEEMLREQIESSSFNVLVDGEMDEKHLEILYGAVNLWVRKYGKCIRIYIINYIGNESEYWKIVCPYYCVDDCFDYIAEDDYDKALSCFLGCDAFVSDKEKSQFDDLARNAGLIKVFLGGHGGFQTVENTVMIESKAECVAAVYQMIKDRLLECDDIE